MGYKRNTENCNINLDKNINTIYNEGVMSTKLEEKVSILDTEITILKKDIPEIKNVVKATKKILEGKDGLVTQNELHKSSIKRLYWIDAIIGLPLFLVLLKIFIS